MLNFYSFCKPRLKSHFHQALKATQEVEIRKVTVQKPVWANSSGDLISKIPNTKQGCWSAQVVECLLNKCKVLNSNPSTTKKIQKTKQENPSLSL
jgi:hypothetical protein